MPENTTRTLPKWTRPDAYAGRDWHGWLVAPVSRHRDSDILTMSNWTVCTDAIESTACHDPALSGDWTDPFTGEECGPYHIVHERHCLVGWVEWIAIHPDAAALIQYAVEVSEALEIYPILDEDHFSEAEVEAAYDAFTQEAEDFRDRLVVNLPALSGRIEPLSVDDLWTLYGAAGLPEPYTSDNGGTYVFVEDAADSLSADDIATALAPAH